MTRESYIKSRNTNSIDIDEMYSHYMNTEHKTNKIDFQQFQRYFQAYLQHGGNLNRYLREKDIEFGVLALQYNNVIKYY